MSLAPLKASDIRGALPQKRKRGPYVKTAGRIVLLRKVEVWYDRKLELGSVKTLARELGVAPTVVEHIVQRIRIQRQRAQP